MQSRLGGTRKKVNGRKTVCLEKKKKREKILFDFLVGGLRN